MPSQRKCLLRLTAIAARATRAPRAPHATRAARATALVLMLGLGLSPLASTAHAQGTTCPCSIWAPTATPTVPATTDNQPIEIGVKFRSEIDGFVTAIRFYKGSLNTGTHIGHLWSSTGAMLAEATFTGETSAGWQEIALSPAVAITANTTYIASYHADSGYFAFDNAFFSTAGVDNAPLHALQSGVSGPNGVFKYGGSAFPDGGGSNNYWVDLVFATSVGPDTTPPTVTQEIPAGGATGVPLASSIRALFSEALDPTTVSTATVQLRDPSNQLVLATVTYDASTRAAVISTTAGLLANATYTATLKGGSAGIKDRAGNALVSDVVWSFTTATPTPPTDEGPGGPILIVSSTSNPFGRYYAEILRTEGLNAFNSTDISLVTPASLAAYDVVILGEMPLTASQVSMFSAYVSAGGNLIAMRPDKQLASLLGLTDAAATLSNAYLLVNTTAAPGAGIVSDTIQFHSTADRYTTSGTPASATIVATLFSDATTATTNPAVSIATVGTSGGHAAAFTFDLARSIVYTRQGNPAWSGQERDGVVVIRSDDLFFGAAASDPEPDWVDLNKVAIPQADEQQRLLANLIQYLNRAHKPLPRFWYLPRGLKAALVMTGDDHGNGGTVGRFEQYKSLSAAGCSVNDWSCIRSTSYMYNGTPGMDDTTSLGYQNDGFEVALHVTSNCADWTPASLESDYASQLATFHSLLPSVAIPTTNRLHCIAWSDYITQPKVELAHGIRFDANYYYYPQAWIQDRPGLFTGSAMPQRFADLDGTTIDVYQATTQMTDESGQTYPFTSDTLFDRALGPQGYYGVITANMHTDQATEQPSDAAVASALARGVPIVSSRQMLTWLDGRNGSSFGAITWSSTGSNTGTLTFTIAHATGANGLTAMLPTASNGGALTTLTNNGASVSFATQTIKGVDYAFFPAAAGSYTATYVVDTTVHVTDTTSADFAAGTTSGPVSISDAGNGEIILTPAVSQDFSGATLPADWSSTAWNTGGTATVSNGALIVDGARAGTIATFTSGRSLEFVATFSGDPYQHIGFGDTFEAAPWAMFSTFSGGTTLYARTNSGTATTDTALPGSLVGAPHLFRIDWSATSVTYSVDGTVVATHAIAIAGPLRPLASDFNTGAGTLSIDWLRVGPYAPAGTFLSRVIDATTTVTWGTVTWTARTPSDTAVMLAVRTGNTPTPDATWTPFTTMCTPGSAIGTTARYAQYRAVLVSSTNGQSTPALQQVDVTYTHP